MPLWPSAAFGRPMPSCSLAAAYSPEPTYWPRPCDRALRGRISSSAARDTPPPPSAPARMRNTRRSKPKTWRRPMCLPPICAANTRFRPITSSARPPTAATTSQICWPSQGSGASPSIARSSVRMRRCSCGWTPACANTPPPPALSITPPTGRAWWGRGNTSPTKSRSPACGTSSATLPSSSARFPV